jgi:hypothetical protein
VLPRQPNVAVKILLSAFDSSALFYKPILRAQCPLTICLETTCQKTEFVFATCAGETIQMPATGLFIKTGNPMQIEQTSGDNHDS